MAYIGENPALGWPLRRFPALLAQSTPRLGISRASCMTNAKVREFALRSWPCKCQSCSAGQGAFLPCIKYALGGVIYRGVAWGARRCAPPGDRTATRITMPMLALRALNLMTINIPSPLAPTRRWMNAARLLERRCCSSFGVAGAR